MKALRAVVGAAGALAACAKLAHGRLHERSNLVATELLMTWGIVEAYGAHRPVYSAFWEGQGIAAALWMTRGAGT